MKKTILSKINNNEIRMKPWWEFKVKEEMRRSLTGLGLLGTSLLLGGLIYWWEINKAGELMELGEVGRSVVIMVFPYWMAGGVASLIWGSMTLGKKLGINYRNSWEKHLLIMTMITIVLTGLLMWGKEWWELELLLRL